MGQPLLVESDEARRLALDLAARTGRPVAEVVVEALRAYEPALTSVDELSPAQREAYDELRELARRTALKKKPGATSDHSDMYDEFGLPR